MNELARADGLFVAALVSGDATLFEQQWTPLLQRIVAGIDASHFDERTVVACVQLAHRVESTSSSVVQQSRAFDEVYSAAIRSTRNILEQHSTTTTYPHRPAPRAYSPSSVGPALILATLTLPPTELPLHSFEPYRLYFLSHLSHPYPDSKTKDLLRSQIPDQTNKQLNNWFVNTRRRSQWSEVFKRFGGGTQKGMKALLESVDKGGEEVEEDARRAVQTLREYFAEGGRDRVGQEVEAIVKAAAEGTRIQDAVADSQGSEADEVLSEVDAEESDDEALDEQEKTLRALWSDASRASPFSQASSPLSSTSSGPSSPEELSSHVVHPAPASHPRSVRRAGSMPPRIQYEAISTRRQRV